MSSITVHPLVSLGNQRQRTLPDRHLLPRRKNLIPAEHLCARTHQVPSSLRGLKIACPDCTRMVSLEVGHFLCRRFCRSPQTGGHTCTVCLYIHVYIYRYIGWIKISDGVGEKVQPAGTSFLRGRQDKNEAIVGCCVVIAGRREG